MNTEQEALLHRVALDVNGHFHEVVTTYNKLVYRYIYYCLQNAVDTEDVLQESFTKAYLGLLKLSPAKRLALNLQAWLLRIAHNETINYVKRTNKKWSEMVSLDTPEGATLYGLYETGEARKATTIEELLIQWETTGRLRQALSQLSLNQQRAILLYDVLDISYPEIAKILQIPLNTVKNHAWRGRNVLRRALDEQSAREAEWEARHGY